MNKKQLSNLLGAGTVTAVILLTALLLGSRPGESITSGGAEAQMTPTSVTLESENEMLRQAIEQYQQREAAYAAQIEQANQLLSEQTPPTYDDDDYGYDDDDDHEEYEHEDEDDDDHEGYEHDEDD